MTMTAQILTLANSLAPFPAGTQILRRDRPWDGAWTVTGCERRDGRWIVGIKSGAATGTARADNYMLAPSDWVDPPIRPTFRAFYSVKELFGQAIREATADEEHQAAMRAYWLDYAAWADKHLAPLGFEEQGERARRLASE